MPSTGTPASSRSATSESSPSSRTRLIARGERADPGQDHAVGIPRRVRVIGDPGLGADPLQGLLDRAQVAHPVVEDRDPGHGAQVQARCSVLLAVRTATSPSTDVARRVDLDRLAQRPGERLEAGLDHVVGVGAVARSDVQGQLRVGGDGPEELLRQLGVEAGDRDRAAGRPRTGTAGAPRCRSRTSRAPRPSGSPCTRSGESRRGRPAPGRAPGRARCRRPRPCGGRRSPGRPLASTRRPSRPWRPSSSSM